MGSEETYFPLSATPWNPNVFKLVKAVKRVEVEKLDPPAFMIPEPGSITGAPGIPSEPKELWSMEKWPPVPTHPVESSKKTTALAN